LHTQNHEENKQGFLSLSLKEPVGSFFYLADKYHRKPYKGPCSQYFRQSEQPKYLENRGVD